MKPKVRLALLSAMALSACSATVVSERPCPRVTGFSPEVQAGALAELDAPPPKPNLARMLDALAGDRAFNRAICP